MNTRLLVSVSRLPLTRTASRYSSPMSTPDVYLAVKGSEGTLHSSNVASSAEVERLWKASKANDKAGEIVSSCSCYCRCCTLCNLARRAEELKS